MRALPVALGLSLLLASCSSAPPAQPPQPPACLSRGATWLLAQQSADGAWRSKTYAAFGEGTTLTAAALWALSACPSEVAPRAALDRGVAFLRGRTDAKGLLAAESPTYATALAVIALSRLCGPEDADVARMARGLVACQLAEPTGWKPGDRAYGGWDRQGAWAVKPNLSQADLSILSFAVEALAAARVSEEDPAWERALTFVHRCQQGDGGFLATPVEALAFVNKAGAGASYSTATCDGVRALFACDAPSEASGAWLDAHPAVDAPEGLPAEWKEGLRFYHAFVSARVRRLRGQPVNLAWLEPLQRPDGSWANPQPLMKEDDPLIATLLAVAALAESLPR